MSDIGFSVGFTDLDSLVEKIDNFKSKKYVVEAIQAYRVGAFRAAITAIWVAILTDIIFKIEELSEGDNPQAKSKYAEIEIAIQEKNEATKITLIQKVESQLLMWSLDDFQFITLNEKIDLDRVREDRNLCAHPAITEDGVLFDPSPEKVRVHIVNALTHLIARSPVQGQNIIKMIIEKLRSVDCPSDRNYIRNLLGNKKYLERAKFTSFRGTVICLMKDFISCDIDKEYDFLKKMAFGLVAAKEIKPEFFDRVLKERINVWLPIGLEINQLKKLFLLLPSIDGFKMLISEPHILAMKEYLKLVTYKDVVTLKLLELNDPEFEAILLGRLEELATGELIYIFENARSLIKFKQFVLELFLKSGCFEHGQRAGDIILKNKDFLVFDDVKFILQNLSNEKFVTINGSGYHQILHASSAEKFFNELYCISEKMQGFNISVWGHFYSLIPGEMQSQYEGMVEDLILDAAERGE